MARLIVTGDVSIDESELEESFVLASGPGGQNVNKVSSAVQLRFDALRSTSVVEPMRSRLMRLAGSKLTKDGVIVIAAREHRSQERNREAAREKLFALIREAVAVPKARHKTKVPRAEKKKRLESKKTRSQVKRGRARPREE
jgi:ribosome-associated protein